MPTTTNGLPYPASTAPPNVPADLQALAQAVDPFMGMPPSASGIVSVAFNNVAQVTVAVTFPVNRFAARAPSVTVTASGSALFMGYVNASASTTGCIIGVAHRAGTLSTTNIGAQWQAMGRTDP